MLASHRGEGVRRGKFHCAGESFSEFRNRELHLLIVSLGTATNRWGSWILLDDDWPSLGIDHQLLIFNSINVFFRFSKAPVDLDL